MKKIASLLLCICIGFSYVVYAQSPENIFQNANSFYENKDYEKAISLYEILVKMDKVNRDVFYNLGNSYFKIKKIGSAILNYERALRVSPRDRDTRLNLKLSRAQTIDKLEMPERGFIVNSVLFLYDRMNINELTLAVSISYVIVVLILIYSIFFVAKRRRLFYIAGTFGVISAIFAIFLCAKINEEVFQKQAIIIVEKVDVRSGPKEDYLLQFNLHEGTKVRVVEERQDWCQIELSKDLRGWIPRNTVDII